MDGWFRTGDQGVIDGEGYLRLTGRLKESITRGGEKIAPIEIDLVLMSHPAVQLRFVREIPTGATGKLQRIGLAAALGLSQRSAS